MRRRETQPMPDQWRACLNPENRLRRFMPDLLNPSGAGRVVSLRAARHWRVDQNLHSKFRKSLMKLRRRF